MCEDCPFESIFVETQLHAQVGGWHRLKECENVDVKEFGVMSPTIARVGFVEASFNAALAVGQLAVYSRVHSKSLLASGLRRS
jgi:hypothetical protein